MATIDVKDAAGTTQTLQAPNPNGQATMLNSKPVVIASNQTAIPVELGSTSLAALESITVGGTVDLGATSLAALESITATGPLTDTQLRAVAVPVNIDASLKSGTATRTVVPSGVASVTILAANANRKGAVIYNSDANALLLDLSGATAAANRCQARIPQYGSYEVPAGSTGAITGIWEADGAGQADVVEFT